MSVKVGINGFGRIGRNALRISLQRENQEVVAINDITDAGTLAHLFKHDSVLGTYPGEVAIRNGHISIDGRPIRVFGERDPAKIPWEEVGAQVVVESTGLFRARDKAAAHLGETVKKVIISAPGKDKVDFMTVLGVNESLYDPSSHDVLSMASCTTNCFAMLVKVLHEEFAIKRGQMTTVHSFTSDQRILDAPHKDFRRARAASLSIIPTSTGAAKAIEIIFPELEGKLSAVAMRVPTPDVSIVDFTCEIEAPSSRELVNDAFKRASEGELKGYLRYVEEELVSSDFLGDPSSAALDSSLTSVVGGTMVKVLAWYDNEYGYSSRIVDLIQFLGDRI